MKKVEKFEFLFLSDLAAICAKYMYILLNNLQNEFVKIFEHKLKFLRFKILKFSFILQNVL